MEKIITKIFALLFFCTAMLLGDKALYMEVEALYNKIPYASKLQTRQILHDLENFYINAVVSEDKKSTIKTLKGIIKCQKLLGMSASTYEKELQSLTGKKSVQTEYKSVAKKNIYQSDAINIKSIKTEKNTIVIKFDKPIKSSDVLSFSLKTQGVFKEIFDIRANLNFKAPKLTLTNIQNTKIAQNRQNKVRIVLNNDTKIFARAFIRKGTLFIKVNNQIKTAKKPIVVFKPITQKAKINAPSVPLYIPKNRQKKVYASSKTIVIDAGHGGKDSGAVGYKRYREKKAVLKIATLLKNMLKKQGYKVYLTRENDTFIKLSDRTHFANEKNADLFISIHANAAPKKQKLSLRGIETFFLSPAKTQKAKRIAAKENASAMKLNPISKDTLLSFLNRNKIIQSNKLAIDIQGGILSSVRSKYDKIVDGGVREAPFWVLVGAQMPAVLVEIGYITNPIEAERLFNPFYQKALAKGIKEGIDNYFAKNR